MKQDIKVVLKASDKEATIKGKFDLDVSALKLEGMQPEEGSEEHVLPIISFDLNVVLTKK